MGRPSAPRRRHVSVTLGLVVACALAFVVTFAVAVGRAAAPVDTAVASLWQLEDVDTLSRLGALVATRVWLDGEWWRVLTGALLHGSWLHLLLNLSALWVLGNWCERAVGQLRTLVLFVATSAVAGVASLAFAEAPVVVGASGGIFGLGGALVVARRLGAVDVQARIAQVRWLRLALGLVGWIAIGFLLTSVEGFPRLAQSAHIGGFGAGLALGGSLTIDKRLKLLRLFGLCGTAAGFIATVLVARSPTTKPAFHTWTGLELVDRGQLQEGLKQLEEGLALVPDDHVLQNAVAYELAELDRELPRAEELVRHALALDPDNASYLDTLGWVLCKQGRVEEGIRALRASATIGPGAFPEQELHLSQCATAGGQAGGPSLGGP